MRLLTHENLTVTLAELDREWSLADAFAAHSYLDKIDDFRALQAAKAPKHG
jgi:hypothetical protein